MASDGNSAALSMKFCHGKYPAQGPGIFYAWLLLHVAKPATNQHGLDLYNILVAAQK
jgi:hypothetical protein